MSSSQRTQMLAGELYLSNDAELVSARAHAQRLTAQFNATLPETDESHRILSSLFGHFGRGSVVRPSFCCDYGVNTFIGDRSFINFNCVFLDCNRISIGNDVQIAPGVHLYTATHPLNPDRRRAGYESALPITLHDGVWLGGGVIVCPGVTIGENTVVGAGSVVTKDLPPNVLAVGNPCRVVRSL
jgi:maltose O-acetyltransferase